MRWSRIIHLQERIYAPFGYTHKHGQLITFDNIKHSDSPLLLNFFFQFSIEIQKFILPVQQNLDAMEKKGCQIRIQRPKKHRK